MRTLVAGLLSVVGICGCVAVASAQESVGVTFAPARELQMKSPWLSTLRSVAGTGDSRKLARTAAEFLLDLQSFLPGTCCDYSKQFYLVLFTATGQDGKPLLVPVLVHTPEIENAALPGLEGAEHALVEVFVAEDLSVTIRGSYDIERTEDPAFKQIGDFVSAVIGKVALPSGLNLPAAHAYAAELYAFQKAGTPKPPDTYPQSVSIGKVAFTRRRAKLTGHHTVGVSQPIAHARALADSLLGELAAKYKIASLELAISRFLSD